MALIIPSTFLYDRWKREIAQFLAHCGVEFKFGPGSDQSILARGIPRSCEEFCLPLKLFCGHILSLAESSSDSVLIPVVTGNTRGDSFLCHPQQRARDIALNLELIEPERVVSPSFTYDDSLCLMPDGFFDLGRTLGIPDESIKAALKARNARRESHSDRDSVDKDHTLRVAVIGTPPVAEDALLGGRIREMIAELGAETCIPEIKGFSLADYPKDFRHFTYDALTRAQTTAAFSDNSVDGVVFLQAFLCGPCCNTPSDVSMQAKTKPFLPLVLDQEQSSAGIRTRLEAFLDIVSSSKGGHS